jgi:hypothetical protein
MIRHVQVWHRWAITSVIRRRLPDLPQSNFRLGDSALKSITESSPSCVRMPRHWRRETPTQTRGSVVIPVNNLSLLLGGRSSPVARVIVVDSGSHLLRCAIFSIVRGEMKMWTQSLFALVLDQCTLKPNSYQTYPRLNCFIGSVVVLFRTAIDGDRQETEQIEQSVCEGDIIEVPFNKQNTAVWMQRSEMWLRFAKSLNVKHGR